MEYKDLPATISSTLTKVSTCAKACERASNCGYHTETGYVSISGLDLGYFRVNAADFAEFMRQQEIKFRAMLPPLEHAHETLKSVAVGLLK